MVADITATRRQRCGAFANAPANDDAAVFIELFNRSFLESCNTELVGGGEEPIYLPADGSHRHHRIIFTHDYVASALHEISHWCIAGPARRQRIDYGYWYQPDGRDATAQQCFEAVEARPQALEWVFSLACDRRFNVSIDNLGDTPVDTAAFEGRVRQRLHRYRIEGLPPRAQRFEAILRRHFASDAQSPPAHTRATRGT